MNKINFASNFSAPVAIAYGSLLDSLPTLPEGWPTLEAVKSALGIGEASPLRDPGYIIGEMAPEEVAEVRLREFIASSTAWRDALFSASNPDRNHPENAQKWNKYLNLWAKPDLVNAVARAFRRKQ